MHVCERVYLTNSNQQYSYEGQKSDVERTAQSHTGHDEGNDEDDEADDHQSSHCRSPSWSQTQIKNIQISYCTCLQTEITVFSIDTIEAENLKQ